MNRLLRSSFVIALFVCGLVASPALAGDFPSTAEFALWYVTGVSESTDPEYTAAFGVAAVAGRLNTAILFNGVPNFNAKWATLKFFKAQ